MGRRFWIAWVVGYLAMLAVLGAGWLANPTNARATAGTPDVGQTLPPRIGLVVLVGIVPIVMSAVRIAKTTDRGSSVHIVVPALLAFGLAIVTWFDAFMPDAMGCTGLDPDLFGPPNPECTTALATRMLALGELTLLWVLFALLVAAIDALLRKRAARRVTQTS